MIFEDHRGCLHSISNLPFLPKQILVSVNRRGVFRGLHRSPYAKYVYVVSGEIQDVFYQSSVTEITLRSGEGVLVPADAAHGFYCNVESTILYALEGEYDAMKDQNIFYASPEFVIPSLSNIQPILSEKDQNAQYLKAYDYLLLGGNGFLGSYMMTALQMQGKTVLNVGTRLHDVATLRQHIIKSKCKYVICSAGISGRPTIEWCQVHEKETFNVNYLDMLNLMRLCEELQVHLTIFGSGLIYETLIDKQCFTEEDMPNNLKKVYSKYRVKLEEAVKLYSNVLYLRILFPVSLDGHPKCFASKMKQRVDSIHNVSVPLTVIPDLFPQIPTMIEAHNATGIYNFVNEGTIALPELVRIVSGDHPMSLNIVEPSNANGNYELSTQKLQTMIHVSRITEALSAHSIL